MVRLTRTRCDLPGTPSSLQCREARRICWLEQLHRSPSLCTPDETLLAFPCILMRKVRPTGRPWSGSSVARLSAAAPVSPILPQSVEASQYATFAQAKLPSPHYAPATSAGILNL